jgi:hypothetical protein
MADKNKPIIGKYVYAGHQGALGNCGESFPEYPNSAKRKKNGECARGENPRKFKKLRFWGSREAVHQGKAIMTRGGLTSDGLICEQRGNTQILAPASDWNGPLRKTSTGPWPVTAAKARKNAFILNNLPFITPASELPDELKELPKPVPELVPPV